MTTYKLTKICATSSIVGIVVSPRVRVGVGVRVRVRVRVRVIVRFG